MLPRLGFPTEIGDLAQGFVSAIGLGDNMPMVRDLRPRRPSAARGDQQENMKPARAPSGQGGCRQAPRHLYVREEKTGVRPVFPGNERRRCVGHVDNVVSRLGEEVSRVETNKIVIFRDDYERSVN